MFRTYFCKSQIRTVTNCIGSLTYRPKWLISLYNSCITAIEVNDSNPQRDRKQNQINKL